MHQAALWVPSLVALHTTRSTPPSLHCFPVTLSFTMGFLLVHTRCEHLRLVPTVFPLRAPLLNKPVPSDESPSRASSYVMKWSSMRCLFLNQNIAVYTARAIEGRHIWSRRSRAPQTLVHSRRLLRMLGMDCNVSSYRNHLAPKNHPQDGLYRKNPTMNSTSRSHGRHETQRPAHWRRKCGLHCCIES